MVAGPTESEHDRAKSPESWIPAYAITILPILDPGTDQTAPDGGLCNLNLHSMAFRAYLGGLSALYSCKLSALNGASSWSAGSRVHAKAETRPPWANIEPKTSTIEHEVASRKSSNKSRPKSPKGPGKGLQGGPKPGFREDHEACEPSKALP